MTRTFFLIIRQDGEIITAGQADHPPSIATKITNTPLTRAALRALLQTFEAEARQEPEEL